MGLNSSIARNAHNLKNATNVQTQMLTPAQLGMLSGTGLLLNTLQSMEVIVIGINLLEDVTSTGGCHPSEAGCY